MPMSVTERFSDARKNVRAKWHKDLFTYMESCDLTKIRFSDLPRSVRSKYASADEDAEALIAATMVLAALLRVTGGNDFDNAAIHRGTACMVIALGVAKTGDAIGIDLRANPFTDALMEAGIAVQ